MKKEIAIVGLLLLCLVGMAGEKTEHYHKTMEGAEAGIGAYQYMAGRIFQHGSDGADIDVEKAVHYYKLAGDDGYTDGYKMAGNIYRKGEIIDKDYEKVLFYYQLCSDQGESDCTHMIGDLYFFGEGLPQDYLRAIEYYDKVNLTQGDYHVAAKYKIGWLYYKGEHVVQDYEKARIYLEQAARYDYKNSLGMLGIIYLNGWIDKAKAYFNKAKDKKIEGKKIVL